MTEYGNSMILNECVNIAEYDGTVFIWYFFPPVSFRDRY